MGQQGQGAWVGEGRHASLECSVPNGGATTAGSSKQAKLRSPSQLRGLAGAAGKGGTRRPGLERIGALSLSAPSTDSLAISVFTIVPGKTY